MLADLADAVSAMKEKSIAEFFPNIQAMWHPVRPGGHGTKRQNQHCIIPARERYPAIDTKCLKRPPHGYQQPRKKNPLWPFLTKIFLLVNWTRLDVSFHLHKFLLKSPV